MSDAETVDVNLSSIRARMSDTAYRQEYNKLDFVQLADQQWRVINSPYRFTLCQAGNQSGKTFVGGVKTALVCLRRELAGSTAYKLPPARKDGPYGQIVWCLSSTNTMTRDGVQARLLGDVQNGLIGTGLIPGDRIISYVKGHGLTGLVDSCYIRADDGTVTALRFKSLDQDRSALQSEQLAWVWTDELPHGSDSEGQFNELIARTTVGSGGLLLTATPKKQQSPIMRWFREPKSDRTVIRMNTRETRHLTADEVDRMAEAYPPMELRTRLYGDEFSGGGLVLHAHKEICGTDRDPSTFHEFMPKIIGFDPHHGGMSETANPSAIVFCAYNSCDDVLFVVSGFKQRHITPEQLVARVRLTTWGEAPCAWGRAERQGTGDGSQTYHEMYARYGLNMLPTYATLPGGSLSLDLTFEMIQNAILNGQLKISNSFHELWNEIAGLERDEHGKIIERHDDLLAALRYAFLDRKKARICPINVSRNAFETKRSAYTYIPPNHEPLWGE